MVVVSENLFITNCTFESNYAGNFGGAIHVKDTDLVVESCLFKQNIAAERGGDVSIRYMHIDGVYIRDSEFYGSTAPNGGSIYFIDVDYSIATNITIDSASGSEGGRMVFDKAAYCEVQSSVIRNSNAAVFGGGLRYCHTRRNLTWK